MNFSRFATPKNRWIALVFLALGLAIVIIDNSVLNVAIPYIIRDLHTTFDALQWVVSGYALIIATLLITVGRVADIIGRKKIFLLGCALFATGSFIASISQNAYILFLGEALIEAIGAAMMLTTSLSLLTSEFQGKERSIAFGIWGSVAGASATIGPLLGGFLTTYYSWRWSLRINVFVAILAILGSIFIQESLGENEDSFDFLGTFFSGIGLFALVFGFIEGRKYGWFHPNMTFTLGNYTWPFSNISIIPIAFFIAFIFLGFFIWREYTLEKNGKSPLLRLSLFKEKSFSLGLLTLGIVSLGQFGVFFIMPIFLQTVLGLNAFQTGEVFLSSSIAIGIFGPISGFVASRIGPKWLIVIGMLFLVIGTFWLSLSLNPLATGWTLAPSLILFGIGIGMASAQLTNITISAIPIKFAGEASAANATIRQVGTSIGIAIIGAVLASGLTTHIKNNVSSDIFIPQILKTILQDKIKNITIEGGQQVNISPLHPVITAALKMDIQNGIVSASQEALFTALIFIALGALCSFFLPNITPVPPSQKNHPSQSHVEEERIIDRR